MWLSAAGESPVSPPPIRTFSHEQEVGQAGLAGRGLILVSELLVQPMVARGWLVPWQSRVRLPGHAYYAIPGPLTIGRPPVTHFVEWLRSEMAEVAAPATR